MLVSWSNFRLSEECPLHIKEKVEEIEAEVSK